MSMVTILKIFSQLVLAETLPKPTEVSEEQVKYSAVTYLSAVVTLSMDLSSRSAR